MIVSGHCRCLFTAAASGWWIHKYFDISVVKQINLIVAAKLKRQGM